MEIIKRGEVRDEVKQIECKRCGTIFRFKKSECKVTPPLGVLHDGLKDYNIDCPICGMNIDFNWLG